MSSEVGSGQVAIFPTFRGFRRAVSREVDGVASAAAQGFRRTFGSAGGRSGQEAGRGFRQAFQRGADGASKDVLTRITADVSKHSGQVARARLAEMDAAGKVRVAEARLAEAREKGGEGSARAIAAEEALAAAQRRLTAAQETTRLSTQRLALSKAELAAASVALERTVGAADRTSQGFFRNVRAGFMDLRAAGSAFTGVGGTIGGFARLLVGPVELALRSAAGALSRGGSLIARVSRPIWQPVINGALLVRDVVSGAFRDTGTQIAAALRTITAPARSAFDSIALRGMYALDRLHAPLLTIRSGFRGTTQDATGFSRVLAGIGSVAARTIAPAVRLRTNFVDGFRDSSAAASAFTGIAGSLGGVFRRVSVSASTYLGQVGGITGKALTQARSAAQAGFAGIGAAGGLAARGIGGAFNLAFAGIGRAFPAVMQGIASAATAAANVVRRTFTVAVAAVTATIGASVFGGFNRLTAIENAQAKLRGLGNDAESVTTIMSSALNAVRGTAFGLDEAATIAASAVAAGVKPGQELEKYLKLTADAATIAGVPLSEMGSILNKVTTNGAAFTEELMQLSDRGIPIFQWLAEEMGVSQTALRKMVSEGKVDAETYRAAIKKNIGGAALESGNTTTGAFANMRAAASRFGVALQEQLFPILVPLFNTITTGFDAAAKAVEPFADAVNTDIAGRILPVLERTKALFDSFLSGELSGDQLLSGLQDVYPFLEPIMNAFEWFRLNIGPIITDTVLPALQELGGVLAERLPEAFETIAPKIPGLVEAIAELIPVAVDLLPTFVDLATLLAYVLPPAIYLLRTALAILGPPLQFLTQLTGGFYRAMDILLKFVTGEFSMQEAYQELTSLSGPFGDVLRFIDDVVRGARDLPGKIAEALSGAGTWLVSSGRALIQGFIDGIDEMIGEAGKAASSVVSAVLDFFPNSPAKKGPLSGTGWRRVSRSGAAIVNQVADGMEQQSIRRQPVAAAVMDRLALHRAEIDSATVRATSAGPTAISAPLAAQPPSYDGSIHIGTVHAHDEADLMRRLERKQARSRARFGGSISPA